MKSQPVLTWIILVSGVIRSQAVVTITEQPEDTYVPTNMDTFFEVEAADASSYQWYRDGELIPKANQKIIGILPKPSTGTFTYQVKVSDSGSSVLSDEVTLRVFDIAEQLGAPELEFTVPKNQSKRYTGMIPESGEGIALESYSYFGGYQPYVDKPSSLILHLEEPWVVTFFGRGQLTTAVYKMGGDPLIRPFAQPGGEWVFGAVPIEGPGSLKLVWEIDHFQYFPNVGYLKEVSLQKTPAFRSEMRGGATTEGYGSSMRIHFASIGETTVHFLRDGVEVSEIPNENNDTIPWWTSKHNLTSWLFWTPESTDETGKYTIRIENEYGAVESDSFDIFVGEHPMEGFDSTALHYTYDFPGRFGALTSVWHTQRTDTFDGMDAVGWKAGNSSDGNYIRVDLMEPSFLTFWYKSPQLSVVSDGLTIDLEPTDEWKQFKILITDAPISGNYSDSPHIFEWQTRSEDTVLDLLLIDRLDDNPFKQWLYPQIEDVSLTILPSGIETDDYDGDGKSNLIEWVLASDPLKPDPLPQPEVTKVDGQSYAMLSFHSPANLGDYQIVLEACTDLADWVVIDPIVSDSPIPESNSVARALRDPTPIDGTQRRFLRLSVTAR